MAQDEIEFSLDDFHFKEFEASPPVGNLAGKQQMAIHNFAGGIRTAQIQGPIPERITWSGIFYGSMAQNRAFELDQIRINSKPVVFTYALWSFWGMVESIILEPHNIHDIKFTVNFEPLEDQSSGGGPFGSIQPPSQEHLLNQSMLVMDQQINSPTSSASFDDDVSGMLFTLEEDVDNAISNYGLIQNMPISTAQNLQKQMSTLKSSIEKYAQSLDPAQVTAAYSAISSIDIARQTLNQILPPLKRISLINPNLFVLGAQYYGDIEAWHLIADTNNLVNPINFGQYDLLLPLSDNIRATDSSVVFE